VDRFVYAQKAKQYREKPMRMQWRNTAQKFNLEPFSLDRAKNNHLGQLGQAKTYADVALSARSTAAAVLK